MAGLFVSVVIAAVFHLSGVSADCDKNPSLFITAPKKIEALSGSCLQISCNFRAEEGKGFDSSREITGVWIKNYPFHPDKRNVVFNSSKQDNIYPINITGNMREKDCTTLFDNLQKNNSGRYYFRMENGPFRATASCDAVTVTVKASPWSPTMTISGDLKENERVTITCSAVTPCPHSPPELTWNLQQDSHTQTKKNKDGTLRTKIQKIITLSDTHDGYTISCSARYPVDGGKHFKTSQTVKTLSVSYAPKNTSASIGPAGLVSAGSWVNLTCSSRANPPVSSFTWFKKSEHGDMEVAEGDFYSLNVTDGGVYYCVALNDVGNQTSPDILFDLNITGSSAANRNIVYISVGGISVPLMVCLLVCVWKLKLQPKTQKQTDAAGQTSPSHTDEEFLYENMDVFRPGLSSVSEGDRRRQQGTVGKQGHGSEPEHLSTHAAENVYVEMKET